MLLQGRELRIPGISTAAPSCANWWKRHLLKNGKARSKGFHQQTYFAADHADN